ncbi:TetR/AcrR family transcriptional regulator [Hymenobacter sp.]|uniref:TetR/AcrR family transcriptional regulator n=1 Tax=Hymenobacter sp. TaxID=1898978 RepID=UPI00286BE6F8|nr:TetR/AcrR family transcriptional regulator [Hymenobacter sp.]
MSETRRRILTTAARLFYQQGYTLTGINQLIAEAGVAKASLYQHFRTKDEVLLAYLAEASAQWRLHAEAAVAGVASPREQVLAVFELLREQQTRTDFRGCNFQHALIQAPAEETQVRRLIQEHKQRIHQFFASLLPTDSRIGAEELALLYEGALMACQIHQNQIPVDTAQAMVKRLL